MNKHSVPPSHGRLQQSWIVVSLPRAMRPSEAELLVAHLGTRLAATYFVEVAAGALRIHAFVQSTPDQLAVGLKRRVGELLVEATAEARRDCSAPIAAPWSPT